MNFYIILFAISSILQTVTVTKANPETCFEVLNKYSADEIKKIFDMNLRDTILKKPSSDIFNCFLSKSSNGDISETKQFFEIFKKIEEYKRDHSTPLDNEKLTKLVSMGLPFKLESSLKAKLQQGRKVTLNEVQNMIANEIELHGEYTTYRQHIEKELNEQEVHDKINIIGWIVG
ncbi:hypothetical protein FF38_05489 [Lucilia cuprina]|uniref:Uncharacterized protein n=1 Tax=Lucilia cuprina TaxID=7375 RepID=A0A0L0C753_LUCCU|nr:hypothetical protein FF38_05489 [Lucilia cuprina]